MELLAENGKDALPAGEGERVFYRFETGLASTGFGRFQKSVFLRGRGCRRGMTGFRGSGVGFAALLVGGITVPVPMAAMTTANSAVLVEHSSLLPGLFFTAHVEKQDGSEGSQRGDFFHGVLEVQRKG